MKELAIEVIFWVGYAVSFSALLFAFVSLVYVSFDKAMKWKVFYSFVFNDAIDRSIKNSTREQMDAWLKRFDERWVDSNTIK